MPEPKKGAVVITGAAGDLGSHLVSKYAEDGFTVIAADIEPVAKRERVVPLVVDITDREAVFALAARAADQAGGLVSWINSAGIFVPTDIAEADEANWHRTIAVNLTGTFFGCAAAFEVMRNEGGGRIVNLGAVAGRRGGLDVHPAWAASKEGVHALTRVYAAAGAPHGILVNAVAPGLIESQATQLFADEDRERLTESHPLKRLAHIEEVAAAVRFLTSPEASYVNGTILTVDGGANVGH
ncbi:SDR family NAD(P)-dependent oxidoreductase [Roseiterribacter gracilis]|uniref:3-oxoacyl-ACP reductase n=1 Tax=Roseiterribacter gracilis TaxID=2812848 RepID=A0A8S8XH61_9PROT|nr:3-oxoacyl-ACP reductase [Rhodospirillales bacterium TMPK1]